MCYYVGLEDLAANAMIALLKKKKKKTHRCVVSLRDLENYGEKVAYCLKKEDGEDMLVILSRNATVHMFRNYSDYFEEVDKDNEIAVALRPEKNIDDLEMGFRANVTKKLLKAYMNKKAVSVLNG